MSYLTLNIFSFIDPEILDMQRSLDPNDVVGTCEEVGGHFASYGNLSDTYWVFFLFLSLGLFMFIFFKKEFTFYVDKKGW